MIQVPEPLKPGHELFVKHSHFPIKDECLGLEPGEGGDDFREPAGVVPFAPADEADAAIFLESIHRFPQTIADFQLAFQRPGSGTISGPQSWKAARASWSRSASGSSA